MKLAIQQGSTARLLHLFIQDSGSATGAGLAGLAHDAPDLRAFYLRQGAAGAVEIELVAGAVGAFTSGGLAEVDGLNMPGVYELGLPDAALAQGADSVLVMLRGAADMAPLLLEIQLTGVDLADGARGGLAALPAAAPGGSGGLVVLGPGGNTARLDFAAGVVIAQSAAHAPGLTITGNQAGAGLQIVGGNAGPGLHVVLEAASAVLIGAGALGHGVEIFAAGAGKDGLIVHGGSGSGVPIRADIAGNLAGTIEGLTASGWASAFTVNSGLTFGGAVAGSLVKEIADHAGGGGGGAGLDAAGVRAAVGLASPDLDAQLGAIAGFIDTELAGVKAVTDKLDTGLESAGGGLYRYSASALAQAPSGGGGGTADWTLTERAQIRHRLGVDGPAEAPAATPALSVRVASVADGALTAAGFAPGAIAPGALDPAALAAIREAIFERQIDALSLESLLATLLAALVGVTEVSGNTVVFKRRDGATDQVTLTYGQVAGQRTGSVVG